MQKSFGRDLGVQQIDPLKIKFADDKISINKPFRNARTTLNPEEMSNKRESIRMLGVLKPPLVRPLVNDPAYTHQIVAGSLRLRCIHKLREENSSCYNAETCEWQPALDLYRVLKCQVRECDEETAIRISIAENLEHSAVPELDLMEYCKELTELYSVVDNDLPAYTRSEIAGMCNRSESWVSLTLRLDELDVSYKKLMYQGRLARTGAIALVLGVKKEYFDKVIAECKTEVCKEAGQDLELADEEYDDAMRLLEDAEIDCAIHQKQMDTDALESAKKRMTSAKKRVSMASDKRTTAKKKAVEGAITADTVNKVSLRIIGAKKGKAKPLTPKSIRELHEQYTKVSLDNNSGLLLAANVAVSVLEITLGKRTVMPLELLVEEERQKILEDSIKKKEEACLVETV